MKRFSDRSSVRVFSRELEQVSGSGLHHALVQERMTRKPSILIADDDVDVVELLKAFIKPLGADVMTASDGEEALTMACAELPDIVLLDVGMPKRSGWEVCQALKAVQRTSHICVVLITGKGDVKDRLTGLQVGADDYLVKPFERTEVISRLTKILANVGQREPVVANADNLSVQNLLFDKATGLPTVPLVLNRVKEILIEQGELGIVYVDIEQFEAIESEYGWGFFEEFLKKVGEVITAETARSHGPAIAATSAVGGSSFYIFLETRDGRIGDENIDGTAQKLNEYLVSSLKKRFPTMHSGQIGFFVGATRVEYQVQIRLERQVYHGMRRAADAVRTAEQLRRRQLTRELRDIIRRKRVTTLFQPIVRASDQSVFGYEILTRGPKNSLFRNSDMLFAFARETKLLWDLEALALESSLAQLRHTDLKDRKFLLNLEAEMFESSAFRVHEMVSFFAERRGHFVFELTERAAIEDYGVFRELLEEFRSKGIEIAIDDAGSGYASLEAIASLAPDYLKITKGLVSTLAKEPIKQDLVKLLVELAHKIGAKTLAEGIETVDEFRWCRDLGIDLLQGYYFARPTEQLVDVVENVGTY